MQFIKQLFEMTSAELSSEKQARITRLLLQFLIISVRVVQWLMSQKEKSAIRVRIPAKFVTLTLTQITLEK